MAARRPPPFSPSIYEPEKRLHKYTLRLTGSENDVLRARAEKNGLTELNQIRAILADALLPRAKRSR